MSAPWPEKWKGKAWKAGGDEIDEADLREVLEAIRGSQHKGRERQVDAIIDALCMEGDARISDQPARRALALLSGASLIEYNREEQCWRAKA